MTPNGCGVLGGEDWAEVADEGLLEELLLEERP